jgi:hypothetical protein
MFKKVTNSSHQARPSRMERPTIVAGPVKIVERHFNTANGKIISLSDEVGSVSLFRVL